MGHDLCCSDVKLWLEKERNFMEIKQVFDSTSRFVPGVDSITLLYLQLKYIYK